MTENVGVAVPLKTYDLEVFGSNIVQDTSDLNSNICVSHKAIAQRIMLRAIDMLSH